jgi:hypothetical protein
MAAVKKIIDQSLPQSKIPFLSKTSQRNFLDRSTKNRSTACSHHTRFGKSSGEFIYYLQVILELPTRKASKMVVKAAPAKMVKPVATAYKDRSKPADIRHSNINAAKGDFLIIFLMFLQFWPLFESPVA